MGSMRVIAGKAKGLHLKHVPGDTTRPITDKVKEALFNILAGDILDLHILDVFGGTGAVGIEALSRGAAHVTFVDKSPVAAKTIRDNLQSTGLASQAQVLCADAFSFLAGAAAKAYDLIYVAPPQYKEMWQKALQLIDKQPALLAENGEVIVQINPLEWQEIPWQNLSVFDRRQYGDTLLIFFEIKTES